MAAARARPVSAKAEDQVLAEVPPGFELYVPRTRHATVTVRRGGILSFSAQAYARLGSPPAVVYLADRAGQVLGFRAAARGERNAYVLRGREVSARRVLSYLGADTATARRYPLVEADGVPCIDLSASGVDVSRRRPALGTREVTDG